MLYIVLCSAGFAQVVDIPDGNLRTAIAETLNILHNASITQDDMNRLTRLSVYNRDVQNLTGLEFATNLKELYLDDNPMITDLRPISGLTQLEHLGMRALRRADITPLAQITSLRSLDVAECTLVDISPLSHLTKLINLAAQRNVIVDITPLANLTHLTHLRLHRNRIFDVSALAGLTKLEFLEIQHNSIVDHSPLDALSLSHFTYDQICEMPPLPLKPRLENRNYPSIFARWSGFGSPYITNRPDLSVAENLALHDFRFSTLVFGLNYQEATNGFTISGDVDNAIRLRDQLITLNPNMVTLFDVGMMAAPLHSYPDDWPYWIRDADGNIYRDVVDGKPVNSGYIDFTHPHIQDRIVEQAIAISKCGLYDGIFFDYWNERWPVLQGFRTLEAELEARETILRRIRANTRPNFLIMGNTNYRTIPKTAPFVNGGFMETVVPFDRIGAGLEETLTRVENATKWMDTNLREPRINGLEGSAIPTEPPDSPANLRWMRAMTTLSLTHSDGYFTFIDRKGESYWYDFWDADLGRPVGGKAALHDEDIPGLYIREYTNGWAVYNHSGEAQIITLPEEAQGVASGLSGTEHGLPNLDGEMYLKAVASDQLPVTSENPADVNGDGVVNILDLVVVAQAISTEVGEGDVNGDGVVNVFDLVFVAGAIGGGGAAPSAYSQDSSIISAADVERWLTDAQGLGIGDANFQQGIRFLEGLLAALTPKETTLLPNYPNPFNPETWIPYRLAQEAEVGITIYDTKGTPVRRLALGNQSAGYYATRGKAAYWDGRNEDGEAVASGIYIYQFRAGDYAASRRMVVVK